MIRSHRRRRLGGLALALSSLLLPGCASPPASTSSGPGRPSSPPLAPARAMAPGVSWLPGEFVVGRQPDGNSVLFDGPDGVLVFDTGRSDRHATQLVEAIRATGRPLALIANSHWHLDHTGGNRVLRRAFGPVPVMASGAIVEARTGFLARYRQQLVDRLAQLPADAPERPSLTHEIGLIDARDATTPTVLVDATSTRTLVGRPFTVGLAPHAATAGDVWLFDQRSRVLASGDLVTLPAPLLDTACPQQWSQALDTLAALPFDWLVPGHGQPMQRAGFETYRRAYARLLQCAASTQPKEACISDWLADAKPLIPQQDEHLAQVLLDYYIDGVLRSPTAAARAGCPAA